tara:strand:- start:66 stop:242 length:177 start_codon:yes stop_codon:yes gene_type:complete
MNAIHQVVPAYANRVLVEMLRRYVGEFDLPVLVSTLKHSDFTHAQGALAIEEDFYCEV